VSAATLAWRHFRLERRMFWRNPTAAFFSFVLPLIFLALFGAVSDAENLKIIVPGIAGLSVMATTFNALANQMTFLRDAGVLKRMHGTPLPGASYLAGVLGNAATNAVVQVAIIVLASRFAFDLGWPKNWLDLVVFTGGVGEHSAPVRQAAADGLGFLGVGLDRDANRRATGDRDLEITSPGARVRAFVVPAREDLEMARQVRALLSP